MAIYVLIGLILACGIRDFDAIQCGTTEFNRQLISRGYDTERGEFPFLAALFLIEEAKFICGGSLISSKHVLTAAHCNRDMWLAILPDDIFVLLGAYDLTSRIESGAVQRYIKEIFIHPDWDEYSEKLDADLAILVLSRMVSFTNYIRPVCILSDDAVVTNANGTIVGWGLTGNGTQPHLKYPKKGITTALDYEYCYTTDYAVAKISSLRTFCGSGGNSSPNSGDSGGGFFVRYGTAWVQYGIVSAIRTDTTDNVDQNSISIYTNVNKFTRWINATVRQSGGELGDLIEKIKIELKCVYTDKFDDGFYGCYLFDLDIQSANIEVASFTGSHQNGKTDEDVTLLQFKSGIAIYIPDGIGNIFKNLLRVSLKYMKTKFIRRSNFNNLNSLIDLRIESSDVENIEDDCFWDLHELTHLELSNNHLRKLEENTFVKNFKLREVVLKESQPDLISKSLFANNLMLEKVQLDYNNLEEDTFVNNWKLREVDLSFHRLKLIPGNLFQNNLLLERVNFHYLSRIDEDIFVNNSKLREVVLGGFDLEFIPGKLFQNNLLLEKVNLNVNNFSRIDEKTFANNSKLRQATLRSKYNQLNIIPGNLFQNNLLLEVIDLNSNHLKTIDEEFLANNAKLLEFNFSFNDLDSFPKNLFRNNLLLETVKFVFNHLQTIDEESFVNNLHLIKVHLAGNELDSIPVNLFANNLFLELVDLSHNKLKTIDEDTFANNSKLKKLKFNGNQLDFIPGNLFKNNLLLEKIELYHNSLKVITVDFTRFKNIQVVDLSSNPCISSMYESMYYKRANLAKFQDEVRTNCSSV